MTALPPLDANGNPIPALRLLNYGVHKVSVISCSARKTNDFDAKTLSYPSTPTVPAYLHFGVSFVITGSNDHYFLARVIAISSSPGGQPGQSYLYPTRRQ